MTKHRIHYTKGLACLLLSLAIACSLEAQTAKPDKKKNPFSKGALPLPPKPKPKSKVPTLTPNPERTQGSTPQAKSQGRKLKSSKPQQTPASEHKRSTERTSPQVSASVALAKGTYAEEVQRNYQEAHRWYRIAANQGNAEAQNALANLYDQRLGVAMDKREAFYWYREAAESGYVVAQYNLGICYYRGEGVPQDYKQAVNWFSRAAAKGDADAQYMLGLCYYEGKGITKNIGNARYWLDKAARGGSAPAKDLLIEINADNRSSASPSSASTSLSRSPHQYRSQQTYSTAPSPQATTAQPPRQESGQMQDSLLNLVGQGIIPIDIFHKEELPRQLLGLALGETTIEQVQGYVRKGAFKLYEEPRSKIPFFKLYRLQLNQILPTPENININHALIAFYKNRLAYISLIPKQAKDYIHLAQIIESRYTHLSQKKDAINQWYSDDKTLINTHFEYQKGVLEHQSFISYIDRGSLKETDLQRLLDLLAPLSPAKQQGLETTEASQTKEIHQAPKVRVRIELGLHLSDMSTQQDKWFATSIESFLGTRFSATAEMKALFPGFYFVTGLTFHQSGLEMTTSELVHSDARKTPLGSLRLDYLGLPVGLGYRIGDSDGFSLALESTFTCSYLLASDWRLQNHTLSSSYDQLTDYLPRYDLGIDVSTSVEFRKVFLRGGLDFSLNGLWKENSTLYYAQRVVKDKGFYLTLGYRF